MRNGMNSRRRGLYRFFMVLYAQKEEKMPKNIILIYKMHIMRKIILQISVLSYFN